MTLLALLLLAAQPASGAASADEDRALLEAFRAACVRVGDVDQMRADALGSGWVEIDGSAEPRMERRLRDGRRLLPRGARATATTFRPANGVADLFLTQTRVETGADWSNACRIYQFGPGAPIDPELLEQWMGRPPTRTENLANVAARRRWEQGWQGDISVEVIHIPPGPMAEQHGFNGNILTAVADGEL